MKILERKEYIPPSPVWSNEKTECSRCKSKVEFESDDNLKSCYGNYNPDSYFWLCPVCNICNLWTVKYDGH